MPHQKITMMSKKHLALVAHDNMKDDLLEWAQHNREMLTRHHLYATGTTGKILEEALELPFNKLLSGPIGGDQQIGDHPPAEKQEQAQRPGDQSAAYRPAHTPGRSRAGQLGYRLGW